MKCVFFLFVFFYFTHNVMCVHMYVGLMPSVRNCNVNSENKEKDIIFLGCVQTFD